MNQPEATTTFGPYRVLRPLGRGAAGTVHLALDDSTNTAVALKVVPLGAQEDGALFNEARQLSLNFVLKRNLLQKSFLFTYFNVYVK